MAVANEIARYFHRKILNIRNELDGIDVNQRRCSDLIDDSVFSSNLEPLRVFKELKEKDVYQLIQASPKKSSTLDPFQTSILLGSLEELLSIITSMVNCSWTLGHFPAAWKASLVDPQLKKRCQSASLSLNMCQSEKYGKSSSQYLPELFYSFCKGEKTPSAVCVNYLMT